MICTAFGCSFLARVNAQIVRGIGEGGNGLQRGSILMMISDRHEIQPDAAAGRREVTRRLQPVGTAGMQMQIPFPGFTLIQVGVQRVDMRIDGDMRAGAVRERYAAQHMLLLALEKSMNAQHPIRIHLHRPLPRHRRIGRPARIFHQHVGDGELLSGGKVPAVKTRPYLDDAVMIGRNDFGPHVAIAQVLLRVHGKAISNSCMPMNLFCGIVTAASFSASRHKATASRIRSSSSASVRAWVWHPRNDGTLATYHPSSYFVR